MWLTDSPETEELTQMQTNGTVSERVRVRLNLRSCNAAQPHTNQRRVAKRPGKNNRSGQQRSAINEQRS
jgi:hypothetical protein